MESFDTANDRFKRGFSSWYYYAIAIGTAFHFALFALYPSMSSADVSMNNEELTAIDLPEDIKIPPPPEQITRPATPVVSAVAIDDNITIAPTTFEHNTIDNLPPPPSASNRTKDIADAPTFTPMTVRPDLKNEADVQRALVRTYPPLLRDAGIGGTAVVWFFIDEKGQVVKTQLSKSSGYPALDEAAVQVANVMRFSPAKNRDKIVQVWVEIPILFTAK